MTGPFCNDGYCNGLTEGLERSNLFGVAESHRGSA